MVLFVSFSFLCLSCLVFSSLPTGSYSIISYRLSVCLSGSSILSFYPAVGSLLTLAKSVLALHLHSTLPTIHYIITYSTVHI
ncbi:hypothetical protein BDW74DRAFT_102901 [Aspergillus multicolor]|uniref:uncharacterized protein n=1 Tax=Aspergillus multicolor TaxID=41759 RepID=UPI003CCE0189